MVRKIRIRRTKAEEDPMGGITNLVDAMLVIAVGFLVFIVISWNMQGVIFSDMSPDEKQDIMKTMQNVIEVNQGQQINDTPDPTGGSGEGYDEVGTVYKDPETGNLIMIEG
ncbi:MAG: DUF2149 domain-containing protein [Methanobrevibacter sp.]|nr:DUF2149 domain-containing protein [Methanobrevibacter sp.]